MDIKLVERIQEDQQSSHLNTVKKFAKELLLPALDTVFYKVKLLQVVAKRASTAYIFISVGKHLVYIGIENYEMDNCTVEYTREGNRGDNKAVRVVTKPLLLYKLDNAGIGRVISDIRECLLSADIKDRYSNKGLSTLSSVIKGYHGY